MHFSTQIFLLGSALVAIPATAAPLPNANTDILAGSGSNIVRARGEMEKTLQGLANIAKTYNGEPTVPNGQGSSSEANSPGATEPSMGSATEPSMGSATDPSMGGVTDPSTEPGM